MFCEQEDSVTGAAAEVSSASESSADAQASATSAQNNIRRRLLVLDAADAEDEMFSEFLHRHGHVLTGRSVDPEDELGAGMTERGKHYARTSLRSLEIVSTSRGGFAEPATVEVKRHASVTAHIAAILTRLPAHSAVLLAAKMGKESFNSDAGLTALLATPLADVRFAESIGPVSAFQTAVMGSPKATRGALDALFSDVGFPEHGGESDDQLYIIDDALRASPTVTAACFPDMKTPLLATLAAMASHHGAGKKPTSLLDARGKRRSWPRAAGVPEADIGGVGYLPQD